MDTRIAELVSQGYTAEEAVTVARVIEAAEAERDQAMRTGRCACGAKLVRVGRALECRVCPAIHAA